VDKNFELTEVFMPAIETDTPDIFSRIISQEKKSILPNHINIDQADVSKGLAKLVLTIIELLRELLERQAIRRIDSGTLTREEMNNLGTTFMKLSEKMEELKSQFGLKTEDLNIDLGPLGKLL
jgi:actin-like ATPase involved in cell morphogenesis